MTASGKSALAMAVARARPGIELVSVDSMQVYREMDIGTAKPTLDERAEVAHHLIDLADPSEEFTVTRFQQAFREALAGIEARGHRAVLVGGTGLYLRAVVDDLEIPGRYPDVRAELEARADAEGAPALHAELAALDPVASTRMEPSNRRRVVRALTSGAYRRRTIPLVAEDSDSEDFEDEVALSPEARALGPLPFQHRPGVNVVAHLHIRMHGHEGAQRGAGAAFQRAVIVQAMRVPADLRPAVGIGVGHHALPQAER